jgi:elongation factor Ts
MMDAKRALEASSGDFEAAKQWLREQGLAASAKRSERENTQGVVALAVDGQVGALVELKSETDFVAGSEQFKSEADALAKLVATEGEEAAASRSANLDDLKITLKENIELGRVVRLEAGAGQVLDSYLHVQGGRGVNGVLVVLDGGDGSLAHDVAVHIAFARPTYLNRSDVPDEVVAAERATLETMSRNEGKPEAALPKIVDGRLQGFFKNIVLLDQPYARDDKQTIAQLIGDATVVAFAQVEIG